MFKFIKKWSLIKEINKISLDSDDILLITVKKDSDFDEVLEAVDKLVKTTPSLSNRILTVAEGAIKVTKVSIKTDDYLGVEVRCEGTD